MRALVTAVAPGLDADVERRFWHAAYLTVVDTDTFQWESIPASGLSSIPASGTKLSLLATHQNIAAAISNDFGPNCYIVLESVGIPMYLSGDCRTVREAVEEFRLGALPTIYAPTSVGPRVSELAH